MQILGFFTGHVVCEWCMDRCERLGSSAEMTNCKMLAQGNAGGLCAPAAVHDKCHPGDGGCSGNLAQGAWVAAIFCDM